MHAHVHRGPLEPLLEGWARLHAGQPDATPFTSPGWAEAWWPHFATNAEPFLVVVREGDELIGLGALVRRRKGPLRILEPVGMEPGDYWDVLAAPARRADVGQAVGAELRRRCGEWDAWLLRCLPPGSPVEAAIDHAGLKVFALPPVTAPALVLPETFDAYLASLSSSHRQNLRRHLRRLDDGEVELREVTDSDALGPAIGRWHELRRRQWESAGREISSLHLAPHFTGFVLDCVQALIPRGQALVWEFTRHGEVIGAYVNFVDPEAFYWYLGGFDPRHTKLGLGKIAIGHGIRTSIEAGRRRFDFGRGAEPYKYWYGAVDRPLAASVVGSGRTRSRAALLAAAVRARRAA